MARNRRFRLSSPRTLPEYISEKQPKQQSSLDHLVVRMIKNPPIVFPRHYPGTLTLLCLGTALCCALSNAPATAQTSAQAPSQLEASAPLTEAQTLLVRGEFEKAMHLLDTLAAQDPTPAGLDRLRGLVFYHQGKLPEAVHAFTQALAADPADGEASTMEGVTLFRLGRSKEAIPLLEASRVSLPSQSVDNNYVLGLCYLDAQRFDDARHAFATQYQFPVDSPSAYLLAARMMLRRDFLPIAQTTARKALALEPHLPMAHLLLGQIALAKQMFAEAADEFQAERALNPTLGEVYDRLGDTYLRMGQQDKAQAALEQAVLLEPQSPIPYILLGHVLQQQKNFVLAQQYLERALVLSPNMYRTHYYLGQLYQALGRSEDSRREFHASEQLQAADRDKAPGTQ